MQQEEGSELSCVIRLAMPIALVNIGNRMIGTVETMLAGRVDPVSLAGTGLGSELFFLVAILGIGVMSGLDPIVSQAAGAKRPRDARRALWQGFYLASMVAIPLSLLTVGLVSLLDWFGVQPDVARVARTYTLHRLPSMFPVLLFMGCRTYLQAMQRVKPIVISVIVANIVNFAASWILLFGVPSAGIPAFGVRGLAWAASLAVLSQVFVLSIALRRIPPGEGTDPLRKFDGGLLRRVVAIGAPAGLQLAAEIGIFATAGILVARFDAPSAAAHRVTLMVASMTFMVPLAIGMATSVRVGRSIGRGDPPATLAAGRAGFSASAVFMLGCGLVILLIPAQIVRLWTTDPVVVALAVPLMRIAAAFQVFDGVQVAASGALRGAGRTRASLVLHLLAFWGIGLPASLFFGFTLHGGPAGIWWGLTVGLAVLAVTQVWIFRRIASRGVAPITT